MLPPTLYQLVILGAGKGQHEESFLIALRLRLAEIGDRVDESLKIIGASEIANIHPTSPVVAVYFGEDTQTDEAVVVRLTEGSVPVLPVVADLTSYLSHTPKALHPINGIALDWNTPNYIELINVALENLSLLRRTRRLFISYLRSESTPTAHQLRVALDDAGYDTFLDTSSVPKGDDFQSILWHRLLDSDVLIVLDTKNFLSSRWTKEELAQASAMSVGMLRVVWPEVDREPTAELAVHLYLDAADLDGNRLTEDALLRVTSAAEALRARCIAARHTNLTVEFCEEAERIGAKTAVQPGRYVLAELSSGRRIAAIPAVGVPDAQRYHEASGKFPVGGQIADEVVLIYDHRGMLPAWTTFLDWLDDHLPVKGLRVTETAAKLGATR